MNFTPFPTITTENLTLRAVEESDWEIILFLRSDPTVTAFIHRPENRKTKNQADVLNFIRERQEDLIQNTCIVWGIALKGEPDIIGTICLWNFSEKNTIAEIGYDLHPEFQGKGIMSESLQTVIHFGFKELQLSKIEAYTHFENNRSIHLLEKHGFQHLKDRKDEGNEANRIFELKNSDWMR